MANFHKDGRELPTEKIPPTYTKLNREKAGVNLLNY